MSSTHTSAHRRIIASVAFASFMAQLDSSIVNVSLPTIARYFEVGTSAVSWVVLSYLLAIVALLLPAGKLGDTVGQKKTFLVGYSLFAGGSLLCGLAPTLALLVVARVVQGAGAALLSTSAYALVPRCLPRESTGWAFGMLATAAALGVTCGAPLGGLITGYLSWHWIFLINVPVGAVAILTAVRVIPAEPSRERIWRWADLDLPGAGLSAAGFLALLAALNLGLEAGWGSPLILGLFAAAAVFLVVFFLWERRRSEPMFDIRLLRERPFALGVLASGLAFMTFAGNNFTLPFYLELAKHLSPQEVGPVIMILSVTLMGIGPIAGRLSDRFPPRLLTTAGMLLGAASLTAFAFSFHWSGLWTVVAYLVCLGVSFGCFVSPNNSQIMSAAPADRQGVASGLFNTAKTLSLAVGICLWETVFSLALPHDFRLQGLEGGGAPLPVEALARGYRLALLSGAGLCLLAALASAGVRVTHRKGAGASGGMEM